MNLVDLYRRNTESNKQASLLPKLFFNIIGIEEYKINILDGIA